MAGFQRLSASPGANFGTDDHSNVFLDEENQRNDRPHLLSCRQGAQNCVGMQGYVGVDVGL